MTSNTTVPTVPAPSSPRPRPRLRRAIALGDLHGSLEAFRTILTRAGLIDGDAWRGGRTILVQLGDVIDRGPDSEETWDFLGNLQVRARKGKGEVVRLLGNHEVALLEGHFSFTDVPDPEALAARIREDVLAGKAGAAYAHGGWLFTHAGIGYPLLQRLRGEMGGADGRPYRFTLKRLAAYLNAKLLRAVRDGDYSDRIFAVGEARGGDEAHGGIFWADYDEELHAPYRAPRFHQVFGHTPEGYSGARFRRTGDGRRINIDIGIAEDYGGNLGYLEVEGRKAVAHYLTDEGETVEVLGEAPLARPRRRLPDPAPGADGP